VIEVDYQRVIPYPQAVVLSQYFDLEHLEHVHPKTFGRARMISKGHRAIVWELEWPPVLGLIRASSRFVQEFKPPWGIWAIITRGLLKGTETTIELDQSAEGTLVREHHRIALPNVPMLRDCVRVHWVRRLDRIWEEDLAVKVCRGGWPGVPR
jgi:hypothetical protein